MTPKSEALAFRIWAYCEPRGWDVNVTEIAENLEAPLGRVVGVLAGKKWLNRVRSSSSSFRHRAHQQAKVAYDPLDFLGGDFDRVKTEMSDLANYS